MWEFLTLLSVAVSVGLISYKFGKVRGFRLGRDYVSGAAPEHWEIEWDETGQIKAGHRAITMPQELLPDFSVPEPVIEKTFYQDLAFRFLHKSIL